MSAPAGGGSSLNRYQAIPVHDDPPLYPPPPASASASAKHQSKGKGKGKAIPDDEEQGLSFGIRFTDGQTPDLVNLWVGHRETVRDLKRRICILRPDTLFVKQVDSDPLTGTAGTEPDSRPRRLRLIQLGRVLPDGVLVVPFTTQLNSRRAGAGGAGIAAAAAAAAAGPRAQSSSSSDSDSDDDEDDDDDDSDEKDDEGEGPSLRKVGKGLLGSVITGVSIARNSLDSSARDELDAIEKGQGGDGRPERNKKTRRTGKGKRGARGFSVKKKKAQQEAPPVWLHCSVGEPMDDEELAAETLREAAAAGGTTSGGLEGAHHHQQQQQQELTPLQGFDRLREAGFSDQDIENLRSEFRAHAPPPGGSSTDRGRTVDDEEEHQRALEEQWMSGMTGLDEAAAGGGSSGEGGHYYSLLKGVCAGFFVPFLPLFFFRTQVFSKRMQIAIVLGIFINLAFGFLRMLG